MRKIAFLLPLMMLAAPVALPAAPADVASAVAASGRPEMFTKLDESRKPAAVLGFLGLERGDRALDIFVDEGYYTELMGNAVGSRGSVLAWNPDNFTDAAMKGRWDALKGRVPNVSFVTGAPAALELAPNSFDFVLFHLAYHDLYWESEKYKYPRQDPDAFLRKIYAATKPGGIVGVVDHVAAAGSETRSVVDKMHRIDPAVIRADFARAGFVLEAESPLLRMPADDHTKLVFDPAIRGNTDRVVYRFRKPAR